MGSCSEAPLADQNGFGDAQCEAAGKDGGCAMAAWVGSSGEAPFAGQIGLGSVCLVEVGLT